MTGVPAALGASSGLGIIPTTDVLDKNTASLELETFGKGRLWGRNTERWFFTQVGVGGNVEIGLDQEASSGHTLANAKWRFLDQDDHHPAVALGVQSVGNNSADPYVALSYTTRHARWHAGILEIDNARTVMAGIDHAVNDCWCVQADWIGGGLGALSMGASTALRKDLWLTMTYVADGSTGVVTNVAWSIAWK